MVFRNIGKIFVNNFMTIWKIFIYKILVIGVVVGLFCTTLSVLEKLPEFDKFLGALGDFFVTLGIVGTPTQLMLSAEILFDSLFALIGAVAVSSPFVLVFLAFLFAVLMPYLWHLSDIATSETLFGSMASQTKFGFTGSFIRNLNTANSYSWLHTFVILPFNLVMFASVYGITKLALVSEILAIFAPVLMLLVVFFVLAVRFSLFSSWSGAMTVTGANVFKSLTRSLRAVTRRFMKTFSVYLVFVFAFLAIILITGLFGLICVLPIFCFVISIFGMVTFFENSGMRYYIDVDTIIEPKKLEQTDKAYKLKALL